ncbi:MAG: heme biosynthesis HemY N-terminal domain-containing protein [Pseudomonadota bacterium]
MKRALLWLLLALALGAIAGQLMLDDPGYVLVGWHDWVLTTSLWVALTGVLILFVAVLFSLGLLNSLFDAAAAWRRWRAERRAQQARRLTETGLTQYAEADWSKAASTLMKAAELMDVPLPVRLTAARAAEEDGRFDLAEQILREARATAGDAAPLVEVRLASMKLRQNDPASARLVLERLRERFPKHPRALRLLLDIYARLEAWQALTELLPAVKAQIPPGDWTILARRSWQGRLQTVAGEAGYSSRRARTEALNNAWKAAPPEMRADNDVLVTYVTLLLQQEAIPDAQAVLEKWLGAAMSGGAVDDRLLNLYGRLEAGNPPDQLAVAEKWLQLRPTHAALLLAAGRISLRNRLWGKARDYFEASAAREITAEVCAELARLYSRLGESSRAEQYLRRHIEITGNELPKLPLPTART